MCLTPILIKNPHLGHDKSKLYKSQSWKYDCTSAYIYVPCGYCKQCIAVKQMYFAQRVQMEARNSFLYFSTLTYDKEHLPKVTTSTGYDIPFSDYRHFNLFIKRLRNQNTFLEDLNHHYNPHSQTLEKTTNNENADGLFQSHAQSKLENENDDQKNYDS